jgi:hypothetical protein
MQNKFPLFLQDWSEEHVTKWDKGNTPIKQLMNDFEIEQSVLDDVYIIVATYLYEDYCGDAFVLFEKNGKLYEVNGSHCSCYGLEGQWKPEEANLDELKNRIINGSLGKAWVDYDFKTGKGIYKNVFADELLEIINTYKGN